MKFTELLTIALTCLATAVVPARAADDAKEEKSLKETLNELLPGMGAEDLLARRDAQQQWQDVCFKLSAPGNEAQRTEACKLMAEKLVPATSATARIWLLQELAYIGRGECVDAVAKQLDDKDPLVLDAALRTLARNPAPEAGAKLLAKLPAATDTKLKAGLIGALGYRADGASVAAVAAELDSKDPIVAGAAAKALGKIGSPEAAKALAAARGKASGELRLRTSDAYLLCADKLLKGGKVQEAAVIYQELNKPEESRPVRMAALRGLLSTAGEKRPAMIAEMLSSKDRDVRAIATGAQAEEVKAKP
jgi:HEAT repeat protein